MNSISNEQLAEIRTLDDFERLFFPKSYKLKQERKKIDSLSPAELGKYLAEKSIESVLRKYN